MRLNLNCNAGDYRNGYLNIISGVAQQPPTPEIQVAVGDYKNLDPIVQDGSVEEILFNPFLNSIQPEILLDVLMHWKKKLKSDGVIKVTFIDIRRLGKMMHTGELQLAEIHQLIFGTQSQSNKMVMDTTTFRNLVSSLGLDILIISFNQAIANIELTHAKSQY